jgi:hypothetical protein
LRQKPPLLATTPTHNHANHPGKGASLAPLPPKNIPTKKHRPSVMRGGALIYLSYSNHLGKN